MWKSVLTCLGCAAGAIILLTCLAVYLTWFVAWGVLPSQQAMTHMPPADLEAIVLKITPLGTTRADIEKALREEFGKSWTEGSESSGNLSRNYHFHVPVSEGDYLVRSDFATSAAILPRVATVKFLVGADNRLKDVLVDVWQETL